MKRLEPKDLSQVSRQTLGHYEESAERFWMGTKDHDVEQNYQALLAELPRGRALDILDLGCGPGRDLVYFKGVGHRPIGLDGCEAFCEMAREFSGCEVWRQDFLDLDIPHESFDGIFANASLFHVPSQELPRVLRELRLALRPGGILFTSNPRGNEEGWDGRRYGTFLELEPFQAYLEVAGFEVLNHYYRPTGRPCQDQPWLAVVSRRLEFPK